MTPSLSFGRHVAIWSGRVVMTASGVRCYAAQMKEPLYPDIRVDLGLNNDRPVAAIALVRRALQHAGFREDAARFTEEAMAEDAAGILAVAARYITVEPGSESGPLT